MPSAKTQESGKCERRRTREAATGYVRLYLEHLDRLLDAVDDALEVGGSVERDSAGDWRHVPEVRRG